MNKRDFNQELRYIQTFTQFSKFLKELRHYGLDLYSKRTGAYAFHFIQESPQRVSYLYDRKTPTSALRGNSLIKNLYKILKVK